MLVHLKRSMVVLVIIICFSLLFVGNAHAASLSAPTGLNAVSVSSTQIDLTWSKVSGATSYQVYQSIGSSTSYTKIKTVTSPQYDNTGLTAGTKYNYKVRAVNSGGTGSFCAAKCAYTRPAAPASLSASSASSTQINLTWSKATGASSYQVYRSIGSSTSYTKVATVTSPLYNNTGLTAGTKYTYTVRAVNSGGTGSFCASKSAYTRPAAPASLSASSASSTQINLTWSKATGASSYQVYRSTGSSTSYTKVATVTSPLYNNTGLTAGTKYTYTVRAVNSGGTGSFCASKSAYTRPAAPAGLKTATVSMTEIRLTWSAVTGASKYYVYRSTSSDGTYSKIGEATAASYTNSGLTANKTYYYRVSAVNTGGEGSKSGAVSGKTAASLLPAPGNFSASSYNYQSVQLYYDVVQNAAKYRIYYSTTASSNLGDYDYFDWDSKDCRVIDLDANTTYYFRVAAMDAQGVAGTPTGFVSARTAASPGNPPQPKFYLYNIEAAGSKYRMNFYRSTSPIYPSAYEPTFDFFIGTSSSNMTYDCNADLTQYFYIDVTPGQSLWYGFTANYGPYASTMQKMQVAALGRPLNVRTAPISSTVTLSWNSVYAASKYNLYFIDSNLPPDPTKSWMDFKASQLGNHLTYKGSTTANSYTFTGMPNYSNYCYIVVPADASGVEGWYCGYALGAVFY